MEYSGGGISSGGVAAIVIILILCAGGGGGVGIIYYRKNGHLFGHKFNKNKSSGGDNSHYVAYVDNL